MNSLKQTVVQIDFYTHDKKNQHKNTLITQKGKSNLLFLLARNGNPLTLQGSAIVLGALSSARKPLNMPYSSVALDLLQSPYIKRIKPFLKAPKEIKLLQRDQ